METPTSSPIIALIDDVARRRAIVKLAIHFYMSKDLMSYHDWRFSCELAVSRIEKLESFMALMEVRRARKDPVNKRTVYRKTP